MARLLGRASLLAALPIALTACALFSDADSGASYAAPPAHFCADLRYDLLADPLEGEPDSPTDFELGVNRPGEVHMCKASVFGKTYAVIEVYVEVADDAQEAAGKLEDMTVIVPDSAPDLKDGFPAEGPQVAEARWQLYDDALFVFARDSNVAVGVRAASLGPAVDEELGGPMTEFVGDILSRLRV